MGRPRKQRRNPHGSAWHWKQTDCWYYTPSGTKKRMPLFAKDGSRIRGRDSQDAAEQALARVKVAATSEGSSPIKEEWNVAGVCSEYIQFCDKRFAAGKISKSYHDGVSAFLNDLCRYCGAMRVTALKTSHIQTWLDGHAGWRSQATHRSAIAIVLAAFNHGEEMFEIPNPLKGMKRPAAKPRLQSLSPEDEQALLGATEQCFRDFLFAGISTGLRPFCELAKITADHVEISNRGMMWRVYSSKTKKTRRIPVQAAVATIVARLIKTASKGAGLPLFRNTHGKPWTNSAGVVRFLSLKRKLKWDFDPVRQKFSCYSCRHTFAHRMLSGYWNNGVGCSIETLAELIGDTPKVAFDHYGKEWAKSYQQPLWAAIGIPPNAPARAVAMGKASKSNSVRRKKPR